jgi:hypothetical protein
MSYGGLSTQLFQDRLLNLNDRKKYDSDRTGLMWVQELLSGHPEIFHDMMRMDKKPFLLLCKFLEQRGLLKITRKGVMVEEQVSVFLFMVGQPASMRLAAEQFQHSRESISTWTEVKR